MRTIGEQLILSLVVGGLKCTINEHGDVSLANLGSAAKRIAGHIIGEIKKLDLTDIAAQASIAELQSEIDKLRKSHTSLRKNRSDLLKIIRDHGLPLGKQDDHGTTNHQTA